MKFLLSGIIVISLFWCVSLDPADAQTSPNTITLDNQSGEFAVVKLVGPTKVEVEVPNGQTRTVNVEAGSYYLLGRYGIGPEKYKYTKGDPFEVTQSGRQYSVITITLHKVIDGNYNARPVSREEFELFNTGFKKDTDKRVAVHKIDLKKGHIRSISLKVKKSYEIHENKNSFLFSTAKRLLESANFSVIEDESLPSDATLNIIVTGEPLSANYTTIGQSNEGAQIKGDLLLKSEDRVFYKATFSGEVFPPPTVSSAKVREKAPFLQAINQSDFAVSLCQMVFQVWGQKRLVIVLLESDDLFTQLAALVTMMKNNPEWIYDVKSKDYLSKLIRVINYGKKDSRREVRMAARLAESKMVKE